MLRFLLLICFCSQLVRCRRESASNQHLSILIITNSLSGHLATPAVLGEELSRRGHNVTLCTVPMEGSDSAEQMARDAGMRFLSTVEGYVTYSEFQSAFTAVAMGNGTASDYWVEYSIHLGISIKMGEFLDRQNLTDYDLIIATVRLAEVTACLSKKYNIPAVVLGITHQFQPHLLPEWPFPPFYFQKKGRPKTSDDMTLYERMRAFIFNTRNIFRLRIKSCYGFICPDPTIDYSYMYTYLGNRVPYIIPTALGFEYPRTLSPLTHYVGPMLSKQRQVLPSDLQQWLDSKPDGSVIMISMGSLARLTRDQGRIIVSAIRLTNYSVVWSLREKNRDILEGLELDKDRYFLSKWLAQVAVLNHSTVRMAIVHGGMNGVHEAIAYGVPIIVIPFWTDQGDVAARLHNSGAGIQILESQLSVTTLSSAIAIIQQG